MTTDSSLPACKIPRDVDYERFKEMFVTLNNKHHGDQSEKKMYYQIYVTLRDEKEKFTQTPTNVLFKLTSLKPETFWEVHRILSVNMDKEPFVPKSFIRIK